MRRAMPPAPQCDGNCVAARAEKPGDGSTGTHPWPGNHTSTHAWASRSCTTAWSSIGPYHPFASPGARGSGLPCRVTGGQPCGDAEAAQHQSLGRRQLLAVSDLHVEQEPVHRVTPGRDVAELLRVAEIRLHEVGERHDLIELVGGMSADRGLCEVTRPLRE